MALFIQSSRSVLITHSLIIEPRLTMNGIVVGNLRLMIENIEKVPLSFPLISDFGDTTNRVSSMEY